MPPNHNIFDIKMYGMPHSRCIVDILKLCLGVIVIQKSQHHINTV